MAEIEVQPQHFSDTGKVPDLEGARHDAWSHSPRVSNVSSLLRTETTTESLVERAMGQVSNASIGVAAIGLGIVAKKPALALQLEEKLGAGVARAATLAERGIGDAALAKVASASEPQLARVATAAESAINTGSAGPVHGYRFVHIKPNDPVVPHFDVGIGIKDPAILGKAENMDGKNVSDALRALWWPTANLPEKGVTLAVERQTPDAFTALAVLANRIEKRKVSEAIVKAVAKDGHDVADRTTLSAYKAIAHITEEPGIKLGDRLRNIRAILDGTAAPKSIEDRAAKFDTAHRTVAETSGEVHKTGVRGLSGSPQFEYHQPSSHSTNRFDVAIGTRDRAITGDAQIIDQEGGVGIIERALHLPYSELPKPGASVVMPQADINRVTAAAILEARVASAPMRTPLVDLIQRETRRTSSEFSHSERAMQESFARVPADMRSNVVEAWRAIEGIASDPLLPARRKVAAVSHLLTNDVPAERLRGIAADFSVFRPSEQPFKYVRTTEFKPKNYDFGVEITNPKLRNGQPNLDHHGPGMSVDTLSASEQAAKLPIDEVPHFGSRVAIQKPDADAITAVAVLANRRAGLPVNQRVVDAVGRLDRGFTTDAKGMPFTDVETSLYAMRSIARNENIPINQRITAARAILSGKARREDLIGIAENYKRNKWIHEVHTEKTSDVKEVIPGRLAFIETEKQNWFDARKLGTDRAPVAVIAARDSNGTHFEVVARAGHPDAAKLGDALEALSKLENGWGGRADIFVSSGSSRLSSEDVLKVISQHLNK